jgi:hypothetical protein
MFSKEPSGRKFHLVMQMDHMTDYLLELRLFARKGGNKETHELTGSKAKMLSP